MLIKPLCAALVMGAVTVVFYNMLSGFMPGSRLVTLAAIAVGADGLFMETHPVPAQAKSDGANMLALDLLEPLLEKLVRLRRAL